MVPKEIDDYVRRADLVPSINADNTGWFNISDETGRFLLKLPVNISLDTLHQVLRFGQRKFDEGKLAGEQALKSKFLSMLD